MTWNIEKLKQLIETETEENLNLDYKSAGALVNNNKKKNEISKCVSAFANANGGVVIYGIKEYNVVGKSHLPERLDPIKDVKITKEWLEGVINSNIRPRIKNIKIHPITGERPDERVYVVEIPEGSTVHQANDKRYYKRYNFESVPMEDYEIRDVMNRGTAAQIELLLDFFPEDEEIKAILKTGGNPEITLKLNASNKSINTSCHYLTVFARSQYLDAEWFFTKKDYRNWDGESATLAKTFSNELSTINRSKHTLERIPILPRTEIFIGTLTFLYSMLIEEDKCIIDFQISTENSVRNTTIDLKNLLSNIILLSRN